MAGARDRERAFQIPLLFELAMRSSDPPTSGRGNRTHDLQDVREAVLRLFPFTAEQRARTRPNKKTGKPYNVLDNELDYAFYLLEQNGEVTRERSCWEITDAGLARLRSNIAYLLSRVATADEVDELVASTGSDGTAQWLAVLRVLDESNLAQVVRSADSTREIFLQAFALIPLPEVGSVIAFMDRDLLAIIGRDLTRQYARELSLA